ncbi:MAG: hypothetical protein C0621_05350 [Desulfuromonas sp.]|nr:MAG: hypothetical protein C0621_05350 [Desulfuromonas sp.]
MDVPFFLEILTKHTDLPPYVAKILFSSKLVLNRLSKREGGLMRPHLLLSLRNFLFALCLFTFFTGCMTSPLNITHFESFAPEEGIVFGQISVITGGERQPLSFLGESKFGLFVTAKQDSKPFYIPLRGQGVFYWHLPAGTYSIAGFEWKSGLTTNGRISASFSVAQRKATYLGHLKIAMTGPLYRLSLTDDTETANTKALATFPKLQGTLNKQLMKLKEVR